MWKEARRKIPETHPLLVKGDFLLDQSAKEIVSRLTLIGIAESFGNSEDLVKRIDRHQEKVLQQELSGDLLGFHFMSDDPSGESSPVLPPRGEGRDRFSRMCLLREDMTSLVCRLCVGWV